MTVEEAFEYSDIGVNGDVTAYSLFRTSAQSRAPRRWSLKVSATMQTTANPTGFKNCSLYQQSVRKMADGEQTGILEGS